MTLLKFSRWAPLAVCLAMASSAQATLFNTPEFVEPGNFAIGLEPQLVLTSGAGVGADVKYTQGFSDLINMQGIIGTGTGPRKFRIGGNVTFDFFPDVDKQPGIGLSTGALYARTRDHGQLELTATPYLHKAIHTDGAASTDGKKGAASGSTVDPFVGVPFGWAFHDGVYDTISSLNFGGIFGSDPHLRYVMEISVAISHRESSISGGIVYNH